MKIDVCCLGVKSDVILKDSEYQHHQDTKQYADVCDDQERQRTIFCLVLQQLRHLRP